LAGSVLDFYHATEYLYDFADKVAFENQSQKSQWCDYQKDLLLASDVEVIIAIAI